MCAVAPVARPRGCGCAGVDRYEQVTCVRHGPLALPPQLRSGIVRDRK